MSVEQKNGEPSDEGREDEAELNPKWEHDKEYYEEAALSGKRYVVVGSAAIGKYQIRVYSNEHDYVGLSGDYDTVEEAKEVIELKIEAKEKPVSKDQFIAQLLEQVPEDQREMISYALRHLPHHMRAAGMSEQEVQKKLNEINFPQKLR
jgi:hypothetical protein